MPKKGMGKGKFVNQKDRYGLRPIERKFVDLVVNGPPGIQGNNTRAYLVARGMSPAQSLAQKHSDPQGSRNLKAANKQAMYYLSKPEVQNYLKRLQDKMAKRLEITQERTLREISKIAFFDPRKLFDEAGRLKPVGELDDDTAAALSSFDSVTMNEAGEVSVTTKIRVWDKNAALEKLAKYHGLYGASEPSAGDTLLALLQSLAGKSLGPPGLRQIERGVTVDEEPED